MSMPCQFFTLLEVAEQLKLPYELVRDKVYSGEWPHEKFSPRNRRMTAEQIEEVVELSRHQPAPSTPSGAHERRKAVRALMRAI